MAKIPQSTVDVKTLSSIDIFNSVRAEMGADFQALIPAAYKPKAGGVGAYENGLALKSLYEIGGAFKIYPTHANNFLSALINRVSLTTLSSRLYENPWNIFKRGLLEMGETVEEIFVLMAKPYQFDPVKAQGTLAKRYLPDVQAAYHPMNWQKFYPVTISEPELRQAFLSLNGLTDLISRIIEQVYTGANYDEFMVMKYMIAREALNGTIAAYTIPAVTADNARSVTTSMVQKAKDLSYMSEDYNRAGVPNYTDPKYLISILTNQISSIFDVEVLALSFHMEKAVLLGNQIGVDGFGTLDEKRLALVFADDPYTDYQPFTADELSKLQTIAALMVDKNWFMIFDNFQTFNQFENQEGLYWTYRFHTWKTFSTSPFANAVLFTTLEQGEATLTISPTAVTADRGQTVQFSATVTIPGFATKNVVWSVSGDTDTTSVIDDSGKLYVNQNEPNTTLTVTATWVGDSATTATSTVTLPALATE